MARTRVSVDKIHDIPDKYEPSWFRVSPSMISYNVDVCGKKFAWKYVLGYEPSKAGIGLIRTMSVRHAIIDATIETMLKFGGASNLKQAIYKAIDQYFISEAKTIAEERQYAFEPGDTQRFIEAGFNLKKLSFDKLRLQCYNAAEVLYAYKVVSGLDKPAHAGGILLENARCYPEMIWEGEILDEVNEHPTQMNIGINYVDMNGTIYIWKVADKRAYTMNSEALYSDEPICAAFAIASLSKNFDDRKVKIVRAIVDSSGGLMETNNQLRGIEEHEVIVSKEMIKEMLYSYAEKAKRIRNPSKLYRQRGNHCGWCEYREVCLQGKTDSIVRCYYGTDNLLDPATKGVRNDDDDMPF